MTGAPSTSPGVPAGDGAVVEVARCRLEAGEAAWDFPARNAEAILEHWRARTRENPILFDGVIFLMTAWSLGEGVFSGRFQPVDFKSYLYWRHLGFPASGDGIPTCDCFGAALIRSSEGHVLLGRQRAGGVNAGQLYPPGGFLDPRDVGAGGAINIDASIWREIREETGLGGGDLRSVSGYRLAFAGPLVAIAAEYRSHLMAEPLRERVLDHCAAEADPELSEIVVVRSSADIGPDTPAYARLLLENMFRGPA